MTFEEMLDCMLNQKLCLMDVKFNDPATIVFWNDGTKTIVKCEGEKFDKEKGLAMAVCKKMLGNNGGYYEMFKHFIKDEECETE